MSHLSPEAKYAVFAVLTLVCLVASVTDARSRRIPNILTFPAIIVLIALSAILGGWTGLTASAAGTAAGITVLLIPYSMGKMGGGDVKLLGAVGAGLGVDGLLTAFLFTCLAGGVQGAWYLSRLYLGKPAARDGKMCYGLAIAAGAIAAMIYNLAGKDFFRIG